MDFEELSLIELIVEKGLAATVALRMISVIIRDAMAETIENNVRKPSWMKTRLAKYYGRMSQLLDELITLRRQNALNYQQYLERIRDFV